MKSSTVVTLILLAGGIGLGAYGLLAARAAGSGSGEAPPASSVISVQVGALRRMTLHRYVEGYGVVAAAPATRLRPAASAAVASPVSGVVKRIFVVAGQHVRRGQLLVELNSATMTEQYAAQKVARQRKLYAEHNTSLKAMQSAEAQLALLRVTAPLAGTVVSLEVKPGTAVSPTTVLAHVIDLKRLVVQTDIPQSEAKELKVGQRVEILGALPEATRLAYISSTVDPSDGAVMTWARMPPGGDLRPGQYVRLRIVTATHRNSLVAPSTSVISDVAGHSVLSIVRGHEAVRVRVQAGLHDGGWVEVEGPGLQSGTPVVTVGAYGLPRRTKIRIVNPPGAAPAVSAGVPPPS